MSDNLMQRLVLAEKYFKRSNKYQKLVEKAVDLYCKNKYHECVGQLDKLPTADDMLESLMKKLKGKSVCRTIEQMDKGNIGDQLTNIKGLTSLLTHVLIEMKENPEYGILVHKLLEKINELAFCI